MYTLPIVGLSRPPIMLKRVVFPDPEGPTIDTYSLLPMFRSTPSRAFMVTPPIS